MTWDFICPLLTFGEWAESTGHPDDRQEAPALRSGPLQPPHMNENQCFTPTHLGMSGYYLNCLQPPKGSSVKWSFKWSSLHNWHCSLWERGVRQQRRQKSYSYDSSNILVRREEFWPPLLSVIITLEANFRSKVKFNESFLLPYLEYKRKLLPLYWNMHIEGC